MNTSTNEPSLQSLRSELLTELSGETPETALTTEDSGAETGKAEGSTSTPDKTKDESTDEKTKAKETAEGKETTEGKPKEGDKPAEAKPDDKTETDYSKAKKDKERFRVNWSELEKQKTEMKAAQAELEKQRQQIAADRQRVEQQRLEIASRTQKSSKYTPDEYESFAKVCDAEGNTQLAEKARAKAKELREAATVEQQHQTQQQQHQYQQQTKEQFDRALKEFPEAANPESPVRQRAETLFKELVGEMTKHGMRPAPLTHYLVVQHADALIKAEAATSQVESLTKKVAELETENKRLTKATALPGGNPPPPASAPKDFASLSLKQQKERLKAEFAG